MDTETSYKSDFLDPHYWLRTIKRPKKVLFLSVCAGIKYPNLYNIRRKTEGLITFYLGTVLYRTLLNIRHPSKNVVEAGAFKGLSTIYLSLAAAKVGKRVKSFELFSGLPGADSTLDPAFFKGKFAAKIDEYETNLREKGRREVVDLIVGDAREAMLPALEGDGFCLAFIDVDVYEVTKDLLFKLLSVANGGEKIIVHDTWSPGVRKSIDELHLEVGPRKYKIKERELEKGTALLTIPSPFQ